MPTRELLEYIEESLKQGLPIEEIKKSLLAAGWQEPIVNESIAAIHSIGGNPTAPPPPPAETTPAAAKPPQQIENSPSPIKRPNIMPVVIGGLAIIGIIGGAIAYAYTAGMWPFAQTQYKAEQLLEKIFAKIGDIDSTAYSFDIKFEAEPREAGAKSFKASVPESNKDQPLYDRDGDRFSDLWSIGSELQTSFTKNKKYPATLNGLSFAAKDPLTKKPYPYKSISNGASYELTITFETSAAIDTVKRGSRYAKVAPRITDKTVIFSKDSNTYYGFERGPQAPMLVELFQSLEEENDLFSFLPSNLNMAFHIGGTTQKDRAQSLDARFNIGADINFEDFIINADAEILKKGDVYYGKINKFPGLFFDISQIKQKWIRVTPDDLDITQEDLDFFEIFSWWGVSDTKRGGEENRAFEQFQLFFQIAEEEKVITANNPTTETLDGRKTYHYPLSLHSDNIARFYRHLTDESKKRFGSSAFIQFDEETLASFENASVKNVFDYVSSNTELSVWVDAKTGFPVKLGYDFRFVPDEKIRKLKDRQYRLLATLSFNDINKKVEIDTPKEFLSFEEAYSLLSGITPEEYAFERQTTRINSVKRALEDYKRLTKNYPSTLSDLTKTYGELSSSIDAEEKEYTKNLYGECYTERRFLKIVPNDLFTQKPYEYSRRNDSYALKFTMKIPPYEEGMRPSYSVYKTIYDTTNYLKPAKYSLRYVDGINTATYSVESEEAMQGASKDSDGDNIADSLEKYLGTNPLIKDTDDDGKDDGKELQSGSNPRGSGSLDYPSSG